MRVLFLGEGSTDGSARYLAAILKWAGILFNHRSDQSFLPKSWRKRRYDAVLLSDYRYTSWTPRAREWLTRSVYQGMGLMMIGGWASFTGHVGGYAGTDVERLLPVNCLSGDDRVNRPAVLRQGKKIFAVVNGYHKVRSKPKSQTLLTFQNIEFAQGQLALGAEHPALVTGVAGQGRTVAFMTDCAPHWAGGLIDWGRKRVQVRRGAETVETGDVYLNFFKKWICWTAGRSV